MNFKLKSTPRRTWLAVLGLFLLLGLGYVATAKKEVHIGIYASHIALSVDCAYRSIAKMGGVTKAAVQGTVITFEGRSFSGRLFSETESELSYRFGLDVSSSLLFGEDVDSLALRFSERIADNYKCVLQ